MRPRGHVGKSRLSRSVTPTLCVLRCWLASTMCTDIALGRATRSKRPTGQPSLRLAPSDAKRTLRTSGSLGGSVVIWPRGARNAAPSTFTTDCLASSHAGIQALFGLVETGPGSAVGTERHAR